MMTPLYNRKIFWALAILALIVLIAAFVLSLFVS